MAVMIGRAGLTAIALSSAVACLPGAHAQEIQAPKLRTPEGVRPVRYAVELEIKPDAATFRGSSNIEIEISRPTTVVWLNARFLSVERAVIDDVPAEVIAGGDDFVGIRPLMPVEPGRAHLHLEYEGQISDRDTLGVFRQREGKDWYAYTQFESISARRAFPCFDEPGYKVPWQLSLRIREEHLAVANTPVASEVSLGDGMKKVTFAWTPPLPSYLVAFGVGPFDVVDAGRAGRNGTPLRIIVPRGMAAQAAYAARVTPRLVELAERFIGVPYPYAKLDSLAIPQRGGAMENVGLITYALPLILARAQDETPRFRQNYASVAAHEISHMWFGDLVTHAWWDDIWLNESFATWMSERIMARFEPSWNFEAKGVHARNSAMKNDALVTARRIRQPIESNNDIYNAFDPITYAKGGAVLGMFESWLGEARFRAALQAYLARHANGSATAADFLAALSGGDVRVGPAFATFLDQPGLPLVSIALRCGSEGSSVRLSQRRYLPLGSTGRDRQTWQIPVCLRYASSKGEEKKCFLLSAPSDEVPLGESCPVGLHADTQRYYRPVYVGAARSPRGAPLAERVAAIGDLQALVLKGDVPVDSAFARFQADAAERNRDVAQALVWSIADMRALVPDALRPNWRRWVQKLFGARARELGLTARAGDSDDALRLRPALIGFLASDGSDARLRRELSELAGGWLADRTSIADTNLAEAVMQGAARKGDRALFERLRAAVGASQDRRERRILYMALGSFADPDIANAALALVLDPAYDYREAVQIASTQSETPEGAARVHAFAKANFDRLVAAAPHDAPAYYSRWAAALCSEADRADAEAFYRDRAPRFTGGPRILAQTLEGIALCAAFKEAQQPRLAAFLARQ
jgi:alanyl aminopeptidase